MRTLTILALGVLLAGCNPYVAAVSVTYGVATDERSVTTQARDTEIEGEIKAALVSSPVQGTGSLDVTCRQGIVVIAGVVPPGSSAGMTGGADRPRDVGCEASRDVLRGVSALAGE